MSDTNPLRPLFALKGAVILKPTADHPYAMREFTAATPDGHRFVIGQAVARRQTQGSRQSGDYGK